MVLCVICNETESRYKCPSCLIRYCSLPCFKKHKSETCTATATATSPASESTSRPVPTATLDGGNTVLATNQPNPHVAALLKEIPEEQRLQKNTLQLLGQSDELKDMLKNESLQQILAQSLNARNRREAHDSLQLSISQNPEFAEFTANCLKIVGDNADAKAKL